MKVEFEEVMAIVNKHARARDTAVINLRNQLVAAFESEAVESPGSDGDTDPSGENTEETTNEDDAGAGSESNEDEETETVES